MHFLTLICKEMASIQLSFSKTPFRGQETAAETGQKSWITKIQKQQISPVTTEIILGRTVTWTSQRYQTPRNQYEQPVQWRCSGSFHRKRCRSWHHNARILVAQMKEPVFDPSNHSASPKTFFPFLSSPMKLPGTYQFWQNGMEHSRPKRHNLLIELWHVKHNTNSKMRTKIKVSHLPIR